MKAPSAEPNSAEDTANPVIVLLVLNVFCSAATAPLITAVSKPNKKPPRAAAPLIKITLDIFGLAAISEGLGEDDFITQLLHS